MCTVSYIPANGSVFLTSNRDEKKWRSVAIHPEFYSCQSGKLVFPKDPDAGGSWIGAHEAGHAIVFLNGARQRHEKKPPYRLSRGLVLLNLLDDLSPVSKFESISLENIEPFTAVIFDGQHLFQGRWDGVKKELIELDSSQPHIWSSCTLYTDEIIEKRSSWFDEWIQKHPQPAEEEILHFHLFTGDGDNRNDLRMNRDGNEFTVSVTSMEITAEKVNMKYHDLQNNEVSSVLLHCSKNLAYR